MIQELFIRLNPSLSGGAVAALFAAGAWGVMSILLSPCHLAGIPLIVAYVNDGKPTGHRRAFALAGAFAVGILTTLALIGALTVALGRMAGDLGSSPYYIVAVIFLLMGLHLMGVITLPFKGVTTAVPRKKGVAPAFLLGLVFGIALGPCSFAYMAPVLGMVFQCAGSSPILAFGLLLAFGVGHCGVIALAGAAGGWVKRYLDWNAEHAMTRRFRKACGLLLVLGGLWTLHAAP